MSREFQRLCSKIAIKENGKSKVKIGDVREILSIIGKLQAKHMFDGKSYWSMPTETIKTLARIEFRKLKKEKKNEARDK